MKWSKKIYIVFYFLFSITTLFAQETIVVGQVFDKESKTPLESVSVYFQGTNLRTQTNEEGYFLLRNRGKETKLIFSIVGYKKEHRIVKRGENIGLQIELEEEINILNEILVTPRENPALLLMQKVRKNRRKNNIHITSKGREQNIVFLSKAGKSWKRNQIFKQFSESNLSPTDSLLLVPLYMKETEFSQNNENKKILTENRFNSSKTSILGVESLLKRMDKKVNFYENTINIMGKSMISPLANVGNSFYRYYLIDSTKNGRKEYLVDFRTRNRKNLAFNGSMRIDSATYALTHITAKLPSQANVNFINNLYIKQDYKPIASRFTLANSETTWYLTYQLIKNAKNQSAQLMLKNSLHFGVIDKKSVKEFAQTGYSTNAVKDKINILQQNKLFQVASYLADASFTGYFKMGKIDVGKTDKIIQYTNDDEGYRIAFPFRTNEDFSKKIMLSGFAGYGLNDNQWKYGVSFHWKPSLLKEKTTLGASYVDDFRNLEFEYTKFSWYNNPLSMSGRNFISKFLSIQSTQSYSSRRKELTSFIKHDWNKNFETGLIYRNIVYTPHKHLPMQLNNNSYSALYDQSLSLISRLSFGEKIYHDHFQKIYLNTNKPIFYTVLDIGKYRLTKDNEGNYARLTANMYQRRNFMFGKWRYGVEIGKTFGKIPYPLLHKFKKMSGITYSLFRFYTMNSNKYISDSHLTAMGEVNFNGVLFNYIPLIKHLNLRELIGLRMAYGTLSNEHQKVLSIPNYNTGFTQPYAEASIGFTNFLNAMTLQFVWRLTDWEQEDSNRWAIEASLQINF